MALPIAPLAAKYGNNKTIEYQPLTSHMRKGGVTDLHRDRVSVNQKLEEWSVNVTVINGLEIRTFFKSLRPGNPFRFDYDGNAHPDEKWICLNWSLTWLKPDVHTFQGSFQQVYRHGV